MASSDPLAAAFGYAADLLNPPRNEYLHDPAGWVRDKLGESLWSKQRDICLSVDEHRRTAVQSCHETGKSYTAARLTAHWIDVHPPGSATVVTTAPTFAQVRGILWKEIRRAHTKGDLPGHCNQTEWWIGEHMAGFGRKPSDYDENAFQGIHDEFVLVILDEACGLPEQLWIAALSLIADVNGRILAIGNPDDPTSHFFKVCQPGSGWNVIKIGAKDTPNFSGEVVPHEVSKRLISQVYLDDMEMDVGRDSPIWLAKVEGEFPEDTPDSVVRASMLAKARLGGIEWTADDLLPVQLGVDVGASERGDKTVIRERRGVKAGRVWRVQSADAEVVATAVLKAIIETGATSVKVDAIGIGWGLAGLLTSWRRQGSHEASIHKVNVSQAPGAAKKRRFPKLRDELWWMARELCVGGLWDLSEIDDKTAADLTAVRWAPDTMGRVDVEKKEDTKKRLGRSPDDADALLLAFYEGGIGASWIAALGAMADNTSGEDESHVPPDSVAGTAPVQLAPGSLGRLSDLQRRR